MSSVYSEEQDVPTSSPGWALIRLKHSRMRQCGDFWTAFAVSFIEHLVTRDHRTLRFMAEKISDGGVREMLSKARGRGWIEAHRNDFNFWTRLNHFFQAIPQNEDHESALARTFNLTIIILSPEGPELKKKFSFASTTKIFLCKSGEDYFALSSEESREHIFSLTNFILAIHEFATSASRFSSELYEEYTQARDSFGFPASKCVMCDLRQGILKLDCTHYLCQDCIFGRLLQECENENQFTVLQCPAPLCGGKHSVESAIAALEGGWPLPKRKCAHCSRARHWNDFPLLCGCKNSICLRCFCSFIRTGQGFCICRQPLTESSREMLNREVTRCGMCAQLKPLIQDFSSTECSDHILCAKCLFEAKNSGGCPMCGAFLTEAAPSIVLAESAVYELQCKLCPEQVREEDLVRPNCDHAFHRCCFEQYVKDHPASNEGFLRCPCAGCRLQLSLQEVKKFVSREVYNTFADAFMVTCPECLTRNENLKDTVSCSGCPCTFCVICLKSISMGHNEQDCKFNKVQALVKEAENRANPGELVSQCPKCKYPKTHPVGLQNVRCDHCKTQFCESCCVSTTLIALHGNAWHRQSCKRFDSNDVKMKNCKECSKNKPCPRPTDLRTPRRFDRGES